MDDEAELQALEAEVEAAVALVALRDGTEMAAQTAYKELIVAGINDLADAILVMQQDTTPPTPIFTFGPWEWPSIGLDSGGNHLRAFAANNANSKHYYMFICGIYGRNEWNITECSNDIVDWAKDDLQRILQVLRALRDATAWCYAVVEQRQ